MSGRPHKPRSGQDRRKRDTGTPDGGEERRRTPERRLPVVEEISIEEFQRIMGADTSVPQTPNADEMPKSERDGNGKP